MVEAQGGGTLLHHAMFANVQECFRPRNSPLLSDVFHFTVPIGAMVVAALFLTRSGRGSVLYDDPPVLGDRMA